MHDPKPLHPVWELAMKASVPFSIIVGGALIAHEVRLSTIEDNRFTAGDGARLESVLKEWTRGEFPPDELRQDIRSINHRLGAVEADVSAIRATIESLPK